jgi:hypothetical protein
MRSSIVFNRGLRVPFRQLADVVQPLGFAHAGELL